MDARKNRATFNPYAGFILIRFYGYDLIPLLGGNPKKMERM
jgi:hypothetical protein